MATFEVILSQALAGVEMQMAFHYHNQAIAPGNPAYPPAIASRFGDIVLPTIMALQSTQVTNISVKCRDLGSPATASTLAAGGGGAVTATAATTMAPDLPLQLRLFANAWVDVITSSAYVGLRPGGEGKKYLSGLTEDWQSATGATVPGALATAWTDFEGALATPLDLVALSTSVNHVVWSPGKGALGSLPARNPLVAPVTGVTTRRFTRLKSRRD